jgi:hypothetical protein
MHCDLLAAARQLEHSLAALPVPRTPTSLAAVHDQFRTAATAFADDLGAAITSFDPGHAVDTQPIFDRFTAAMSTWTDDVARSDAELSSQLTTSVADVE